MTTTYTLGQMTDDTLRQLRGTTRDMINTLQDTTDAPVALTVETIYFSQPPNGVVQGSLLSVADETMYVLSSDQLSKTASVLRGYDGTTPAVQAAGSLVLVDTPWPRAIIQQQLRDEIRSWGPQVFAVGAVDLPIVSMQRGYDLGAVTTPIIRILAVTAPAPPYVGAPGYWAVPGTDNQTLADSTFSFIYDANANTAEFPSGKSLTLTSPVTPNYAGNIHVVYAKPFDVDTSWADTTDMIANVGIDSRDLDIAPLGASARLMRWMTVRRGMLNVQGQSSADQDVTMPAILQAMQGFQMSAKLRLNDVQLRLLSDFPIRSSNY